MPIWRWTILKRSLAASQTLRHKTLNSGILHAIGDAYRVKGEHEQALSYYQRSLAPSEGDAARRTQAVVFIFSIGETYRLQGQYQKALDTYKKAHADGQNRGLPSGRTSRLNTFRRSPLRTRPPPGSAGLAEQAYDLAIKFKDSGNVAGMRGPSPPAPIELSASRKKRAGITTKRLL